jgi:kynurenine 3-monooxygenase
MPISLLLRMVPGRLLERATILNVSFYSVFSQNWLTHGYKELTILPSKEGGYKTYKNALHIWPRGEFMLIALPNLDGSFTVTLFLAYEGGTYNFNNLTNPQIVTKFFEEEFPDALTLMPNLTKDFFENPTAPLGDR